MSDFSRYSRQVVLPEVGVNGQAILRDSTVLLVGLGGLGSLSALYLAGAGVGRLLLCDPDHVTLSNLQRQVIYRSADLGRNKAEAAAAQLRALNPEVETEVIAADTWSSRLADVDLVLDGSDNFPTRFATNAACVQARVPLVFAAAIRFEGQLGLIDPARRGGCYACLYPETGAAAERCEDAGILGPVVGTMAAQQALLALRRLLGLADDAGTLHTWCARTLQWRAHSLPRDPDCSCCATPP